MSKVKLIFVIFTCLLAVNAVDICQTEDVIDNYDFHLTSPNYPKRYPDALDCTFTIYCPPNKSIRLKMLQFVTEKDHDYLNVTIGNITSKYDGRFSGHSLGIHNVSSIKFLFHSDYITGLQGFNISYSFITNLPTEIEKSSVLTRVLQNMLRKKGNVRSSKVHQ